MKYKKHLLLTSLWVLITSYNYTQERPPEQINKDFLSHYHIIERTILAGKLILIPTVLSILVYTQHKSIYNTVKNYPISSMIASYSAVSFISDTFVKYKQIAQALQLLQTSKKIYRYILYAIGIKNTMIQLSKKSIEFSFCEEDFCKTITSYIPLSFTELEQLTFDLLHKTSSSIENLHLIIESNLDETIYILSKEHITIDQLLQIYQDDTEIYPYLEKFHQNPTKYYHETILHLNTLIKNHLQYILTQ